MKEFLNVIVIILFWKNVVAQEGVDCLGKAFHCVNSTHFLICVNLGHEMSITVDQRAIECPPLTACHIQNDFECELVSTTSAMPITVKTTLPSDVSTTVSASSTLSNSARLWEATVINVDTITVPADNTTAKTVTAEKEALTDSKQTRILSSLDTENSLIISSESSTTISAAQAKQAATILSSRNGIYLSDSSTTKTAYMPSAAANSISNESDGDKTALNKLTKIVSSTSMPAETKINISNFTADSNTTFNSIWILSNATETARSTVISDITINSSYKSDSILTTVRNVTEIGSGTTISTITKSNNSYLPEDHNASFNATELIPIANEIDKTTISADITKKYSYTSDGFQAIGHNVSEIGSDTTNSMATKSNISNFPEDDYFNAIAIIPNETKTTQNTVMFDIPIYFSNTSDGVQTTLNNISEISSSSTKSTLTKSSHSNLAEDHNISLNLTAITPSVTENAQSTVMSENRTTTKTIDSNSIIVTLSTFEQISVTSISTSNATSSITLMEHTTEVPSTNPTTYNTLNLRKSILEMTNHAKTVNNFATTQSNVIKIKDTVTSPLISVYAGNGSAVPDKIKENYTTSLPKSISEFHHTSTVTPIGNYGSSINGSLAALENLLYQKSTLTPNLLTTHSKNNEKHESTASVLQTPSLQFIELSPGNTAILSENSRSITNTFDEIQSSIAQRPLENHTIISTPKINFDRNKWSLPEISPITESYNLGNNNNLSAVDVLLSKSSISSNPLTTSSDTNKKHQNLESQNLTSISNSNKQVTKMGIPIRKSTFTTNDNSSTDQIFKNVTKIKQNPTETSIPKYTIPIIAENSTKSTKAEHSFQNISFQVITTTPLPSSGYVAVNITLESTPIFTLNETENAKNLSENTIPPTISTTHGKMNFEYNTLYSTVYLENSKNNTVESSTKKSKSTTLSPISTIDQNSKSNVEILHWPVNEKTVSNSRGSENTQSSTKLPKPQIPDNGTDYLETNEVTLARNSLEHMADSRFTPKDTFKPKDLRINPYNTTASTSVRPVSENVTVESTTVSNINNTGETPRSFISTNSDSVNFENFTDNVIFHNMKQTTATIPVSINMTVQSLFKINTNLFKNNTNLDVTPNSFVKRTSNDSAMSQINRDTGILLTTLKSTTGSTHELIHYESDSIQTPVYIVKEIKENVGITLPITSNGSVSTESYSVSSKTSPLNYTTTTTPTFPESETRPPVLSSVPKMYTSTNNVIRTHVPTEHYLHQVSPGITEATEKKNNPEKDFFSSVYKSTSGLGPSAYQTLVNKSAKSTTISSLNEMEKEPVISTQYYHSKEHAFETVNSFMENTKSTSINNKNKFEIQDIGTSKSVISTSLESTIRLIAPSEEVTKNFISGDILNTTINTTNNITSDHLIINAPGGMETKIVTLDQPVTANNNLNKIEDTSTIFRDITPNLNMQPISNFSASVTNPSVLVSSFKHNIEAADQSSHSNKSVSKIMHHYDDVDNLKAFKTRTSTNLPVTHINLAETKETTPVSPDDNLSTMSIHTSGHQPSTIHAITKSVIENNMRLTAPLITENYVSTTRIYNANVTENEILENIQPEPSFSPILNQSIKTNFTINTELTTADQSSISTMSMPIITLDANEIADSLVISPSRYGERESNSAIRSVTEKYSPSNSDNLSWFSSKSHDIWANMSGINNTELKATTLYATKKNNSGLVQNKPTTTGRSSITFTLPTISSVIAIEHDLPPAEKVQGVSVMARNDTPNLLRNTEKPNNNNFPDDRSFIKLENIFFVTEGNYNRDSYASKRTFETTTTKQLPITLSSLTDTREHLDRSNLNENIVPVLATLNAVTRTEKTIANNVIENRHKTKNEQQEEEQTIKPYLPQIVNFNVVPIATDNLSHTTSNVASPVKNNQKEIMTTQALLIDTSQFITKRPLSAITYDIPVTESNVYKSSLTEVPRYISFASSAFHSTVPLNPIIDNTLTKKSSTVKIISSNEFVNANHVDLYTNNNINLLPNSKIRNDEVVPSGKVLAKNNNIETTTAKNLKSYSVPSIVDKSTGKEYRRIEPIAPSESLKYVFSTTVESPVTVNKLPDNINKNVLDSIATVNSATYSQSLNDVAQVTRPVQLKDKFRSDGGLRDQGVNSAETSNTAVIEGKDMLDGSNFTCNGKSKGRYADSQNSKKFYICVGISNPIVGFCPLDTIYISSESKCCKSATVCEQFHCSKEGRFKDMCSYDSYYICQFNASDVLVRYKLKCQTGYYVSTLVKCTPIVHLPSTSQELPNTANSFNDQNNKTNKATVPVTCSGNEVYNVSTNKCDKLENSCVQFHCSETGRYKDKCSSNSYYICVSSMSGALVRYKLKCQLGYEVNSTNVQCVPIVDPLLPTDTLLNITNTPKIKNKERNFDKKVNNNTTTNTTYYINTETPKAFKDKDVTHYPNNYTATYLKINEGIEKKIKEYNIRRNDKFKITKKVESKKNKDNSKESSEEKYENSEKKKQIKREIKSSDSEEKREFVCDKEGVYPNPQNYRKYFECTYNKKRNQFRKRLRSCKSRETFDMKEKKCVCSENVSKESRSIES